MVKVGISGFGRLGRLVFRALVEQGLPGKTLDLVALNDIVPADNLAYLVKYDSTQGRFTGTVTSEKSSPSAAEDDLLVVNGYKIKCLAVQEGPAAVPWKQLVVGSWMQSTGLLTQTAKAVGRAMPEVKGKLTGMEVRVPTPTVSVVDLTVKTTKATSYKDICAAMKKASESYLMGILAYSDDEVVSSDFIHDAHSCIF